MLGPWMLKPRCRKWQWRWQFCEVLNPLTSSWQMPRTTTKVTKGFVFWLRLSKLALVVFKQQRGVLLIIGNMIVMVSAD